MNPQDIALHRELESSRVRMGVADGLHIVDGVEEILGRDLHVVPTKQPQTDIDFRNRLSGELHFPKESPGLFRFVRLFLAHPWPIALRS